MAPGSMKRNISDGWALVQAEKARGARSLRHCNFNLLYFVLVSGPSRLRRGQGSGPTYGASTISGIIGLAMACRPRLAMSAIDLRHLTLTLRALTEFF